MRATTCDVLRIVSDQVARLDLGPLLASIRSARDAGRSWFEIGNAMGLDGGDDALSVDETAFALAAGLTRLAGDEAFTWRCGACEQVVTDHESWFVPRVEHGHDPGCARPAADLEADRAGRIWRRAVTGEGGDGRDGEAFHRPGPGDRDVAALVELHDRVYGGGSPHAVGAVPAADLEAASTAALAFGLEETARVLAELAEHGFGLAGQEAQALADAYERVSVDPGALYGLFRQRLREAPGDFAPLPPRRYSLWPGTAPVADDDPEFGKWRGNEGETHVRPLGRALWWAAWQDQNHLEDFEGTEDDVLRWVGARPAVRVLLLAPDGTYRPLGSL